MKIVLLIVALFGLTASTASAQGGINLYWDDCGAWAGRVNMNFACNTNTGNHDLYVSVASPIHLQWVHGSDQILDLQSAGAILPAWWQFKNAGACRMSSLSGRDAGISACESMWSGEGHAAILSYLVTANTPSMPPNRARMVGSVGAASPFAGFPEPGTEYISMIFRINSAKTVGSDACTGCEQPVCLVLNEVRLYPAPPLEIQRIVNPLTNNFVTWQGGEIDAPGCPGATSAGNRTWGQIKSIYR